MPNMFGDVSPDELIPQDYTEGINQIINQLKIANELSYFKCITLDGDCEELHNIRQLMDKENTNDSFN